VAEEWEGEEVKARSKYGATPTTVDGIRFHSKGEAGRWSELKLLQKAGQIIGLMRQVPMMLHAGNGALVGRYVADFYYLERGVPVYEDFKGFDTAVSKWKRRHVAAEYGIEVKITK
jgi:hypothetical protein